MYCSECKLRVADDSIVLCPVCQGPLQPDTVNEPVFSDNAGEDESVAPDIQVEDKFGAYERHDQDFDFNLENLGLESSVQKDPAEDDEDIQVLTDIWEEEGVDADLEGVIAEALSLEEANDDIEVKDGLDSEDDSDFGEASKPGKPGVSPIPPSIEAPSQSRSLWVLLLLIFVIGAGGGIWLYSQKSKSAPVKRVVRSIPQPHPVKSAPLLPAKETVVAGEITTAEPVAVAVGNVVDDKAGKLVTTAPVQVEARVEVTDLKDNGSEIQSQEEKTTLSLSPIESVVKPVKNSETLVASLESAEEETSAAKDSVETGAKAVAKTKPLVSSLDSSPQEGSDRQSKETVVDKASLTFPYAIHIGSFKRQKQVATQLAMLKKKGFSAYQVEVDLKAKGVWQRVMIPGGTTREEAEIVQRKLAEFFPREDSRILKIKK